MSKQQTFGGKQLAAAEKFVAGLVRYVPDEERTGRRGNRAALAALRRALGKPIGETLNAFPYVVPLLPQGLRPWDEQCHYLVASLFALYPEPWTSARRQSLGLAMRLMARKQSDERSSGADTHDESENVGGKLDAAVERRFVALLNASGDGFATHLRYAVTLLKSHDQRIDWARLLCDARGWQYPDWRVQRAWARDFWASGAHDAKPAGDGDGDEAADAGDHDDSDG